MYKAHQLAETQQFIENAANSRKTIGFVPTMGALHQGHLELVKKSIAECDITVVSIFVNPTQFNNSKDFEKYPNTVEEDIALLTEQGVDFLFLPSVDVMYPKGASSFQNIDLGGLDKVLEGVHRPGHFEGVVTIVHKLFELIRPSRAYFGEKDYQQYRIIEHYSKAVFPQIEVVPCPTIRQQDGLALSSRNKRLSGTHLILASTIYETLAEINQQLMNGTSIQSATAFGIKKLSLAGFNVEYVSVFSEYPFEEASELTKNRTFRAFVAASLHDVRLIDNLRISWSS